LAAPPDIDLSLNEVESLALKAARGSGLPWGVAEDTGRAAVWMARHAGGWAGALLRLLETPPPRGEHPLLLAGFLADTLGAGPRTVERAVEPGWLLPGLLLPPPTRPLSIRIGATEIRFGTQTGPTATCPADSLLVLPPSTVAVLFPDLELPALPHVLAPRLRRGCVALDDWRRLDALAQRTYVPASDASRRRGAGGARLDDD